MLRLIAASIALPYSLPISADQKQYPQIATVIIRPIGKPATEQPTESPTNSLRSLLEGSLAIFESNPPDTNNARSLELLHDARSKMIETIQRYRAALREMVVRFEILDQDLNLKKDRNPIHHVESRIKSTEGIFEKLERYGKEPTIENAERYIMDIAGVRVICSYIHDV